MNYIRRRLREGATWVGIGAAIAAALATGSQYLTAIELQWLTRAVIVAGILAAVLPTSRRKSDDV